MWKNTTVDVYIVARPDLFFVQFQSWGQSSREVFNCGSVFEVAKMDRNTQYYPLRTEDYLCQTFGRWKHGPGHQIRFFFIRSGFMVPKTFALTCCDFTFLANWIVIGDNSLYSHQVGYMNHLAQKRGTYTRHFRIGWEEDRYVWRMLRNVSIAQQKSKDGATQQKLCRKQYEALGFKLLGKTPREVLDNRDWNHGV